MTKCTAAGFDTPQATAACRWTHPVRPAHPHVIHAHLGQRARLPVDNPDDRAVALIVVRSAVAVASTWSPGDALRPTVARRLGFATGKAVCSHKQSVNTGTRTTRNGRSLVYLQPSAQCPTCSTWTFETVIPASLVPVFQPNMIDQPLSPCHTVESLRDPVQIQGLSTTS